MNIENGEISTVRRPTDEELASGKVVILTPKEAAIFGTISMLEMRKIAYDIWKRYSNVKQWNNVIEKNKAMEAFVFGVRLANMDTGGNDANPA